MCLLELTPIVTNPGLHTLKEVITQSNLRVYHFMIYTGTYQMSGMIE